MAVEFLELKDLQIGIKANVAQLSHILDKNMILVYEHAGDKEGTLVYIGNQQDAEYDRWFMQEKPITPIYNTEMDYDYDE